MNVTILWLRNGDCILSERVTDETLIPVSRLFGRQAVMLIDCTAVMLLVAVRWLYMSLNACLGTEARVVWVLVAYRLS